VHSIYDLQGSTYSKTSQDSITNAIVPLKKQSFSATLPATLNLSFETKVNNYFILTEGVRYIYNANYTLLIYAKADFFINKKLALSATGGFGGYGKFNYGLGAVIKPSDNFYVYIGSNNIAGFIAPRKTVGQGVYISLVKTIK
jgi:hypothetical protein